MSISDGFIETNNRSESNLQDHISQDHFCIGRTEQEMRALVWFGNPEYTKHDTVGVGI
jgi:hypothetical protein